MRLKSSIFLWVSLATILPLTALVLGITAYSERLYRQNVDDTIQTGMKNIVSELDFRLNYEREVILSLASSPAMKRFSRTLEAVSGGDFPASYFDETRKLDEFLAGFQHSVPGLDTVSVLDREGNALVSVKFGQKTAEQHINSKRDNRIAPAYLEWMQQLKPFTLVYGELPSQDSPGNLQDQPLLNAIVPLANSRGQTIGFLTARSRGDQLDHILQVLPRSYDILIDIIELNPHNRERHGMLLYSDVQNIIFNQPHQASPKLWQQMDTKLWDDIGKNRYGMFHSTDQNHLYYYQEFYPYSNQLVSWVLMLEVDNEELTAPFVRIRFGLLAFAAVALIISLILANLGARHIAKPITRFSTTLKRYADGETTLPNIGNSEKMAEELQQLEHSFNYLAETLLATARERDRAQHMMMQQAKLASIGQMAAGIGHEINNPLNNILSYVKLIERDAPDNNPQLQQDLRGLRDEAQRAGRIVKGVLNFARQVPPEYTRFDLLTFIQDTTLLVAPEAKKRRVTIEVQDVPDKIIHGDRNQLQQVLVNLLMNAIQASAEGRVINIYAQSIDTRHIRMVVSDEGTGISEKNRDKIFDPFFSTKSVGEGSGLGLSISLGIIQTHQGQLELHNNDRGGVDAVITLPSGSDASETES
jgi:two-component system NtrC family sensor kinase